MPYPIHTDFSDNSAIPGSQLAMMVLDKFGMVRYCSVFAARLFHAGAQELIGRSINAVVPQLPLRPDTPGYNVAYATFWSALNCGQEYTVIRSQGDAVPIRVFLEKLSGEGQHQILVYLTPAEKREAVCADFAYAPCLPAPQPHSAAFAAGRA